MMCAEHEKRPPRTKRRRVSNVAAAIVGLALAAACGFREPRSEIVTMVEKAGANDLDLASIPMMRRWLDEHPDITLKADRMCDVVRSQAAANWPSTTEGRLCEAVKQAWKRL